MPWGMHVVAVANHKCRFPALCLASPVQGKLDLNLPAIFLEVANFLSRCKKSFLCQPSCLWGAHLFLAAGCWRHLQGPAGVAKAWPISARTDGVACARRHSAAGRDNSRRASRAGARLSRRARRRAGRHPEVGGDCGASDHGTSAPQLRRSRRPAVGRVREGRDGECVPRRSHCIAHEEVREVRSRPPVGG